jgi:hypothetical protein
MKNSDQLQMGAFVVLLRSEQTHQEIHATFVRGRTTVPMTVTIGGIVVPMQLELVVDPNAKTSDDVRVRLVDPREVGMTGPVNTAVAERFVPPESGGFIAPDGQPLNPGNSPIKFYTSPQRVPITTLPASPPDIPKAPNNSDASKASDGQKVSIETKASDTLKVSDSPQASDVTQDNKPPVRKK